MMTPEQIDHLQKRHDQLLKAATDFFNADLKCVQYPYNESYKDNRKQKKKRLQELVKQGNIDKSKKQTQISFT